MRGWVTCGVGSCCLPVLSLCPVLFFLLLMMMMMKTERKNITFFFVHAARKQASARVSLLPKHELCFVFFLLHMEWRKREQAPVFALRAVPCPGRPGGGCDRNHRCASRFGLLACLPRALAAVAKWGLFSPPAYEQNQGVTHT